MGKAAKEKQRHEPLYQEYQADNSKDVTTKSRKKFKNRELNREKKEQDQGFVNSKMSNKILKAAREQQEEIELEENDLSSFLEYRGSKSSSKKGSYEIEESDEDDLYSSDGEFSFQDFDSLEIEIDPKDAEIFEKLMPQAPQKRQNLADIIAAKIQEFNEAKSSLNASQGIEDANSNSSIQKPAQGINPKVAEVYKKVGELLSRYKSGALPKAFKIIPSIKNWEQVLYLTSPHSWTPHSVYQATRIFISNMKPKQSQKFLSLILLDRVREDIRSNKKLNYHLYMALKKALYRPAAFFKGILFPLCESGDCTLRESVIIGSVLSKVSIPVLHSAAALMHLANLEYNGPIALFIRILLDKKYALPYRVVDALVFHFIQFTNPANVNASYLNDNGQLPVLWHQSLLVFVQRYKTDLAPDQKAELHKLLKVHYHPQISEEIKRELNNSTSRGEIIAPSQVDHTNMPEIEMN
ncbi:hypothetical protein BB560_001339 [Smittium megazygosporum]|uniref:Bystin n=1 Tax=Smittium megazygosporum TaxID=133381 RepID=A0A2T9ZI34_9FUNG|nr:hypothetical protein BB560_001339 [Smittium megazygosporum]